MANCASFIEPGIILRFGLWVSIIQSWVALSLLNRLTIEFSTVLVNTPSPVVAFAWGSVSISRTLYSNIPKAIVKFIAVVVLPTPPFWFTIDMIFDSGIWDLGIHLQLTFKKNWLRSM